MTGVEMRSEKREGMRKRYPMGLQMSLNGHIKITNSVPTTAITVGERGGGVKGREVSE
jgi:hypothetical protein